MTRVPAAAPAATPSGPNSTALDVRRVGDADEDDVDSRRQAPRASAAIVTPSASSSAARPAVRFHAASGKPGPGEVGSHGAAHRAEAEDSDGRSALFCHGQECRRNGTSPERWLAGMIKRVTLPRRGRLREEVGARAEEGDPARPVRQGRQGTPITWLTCYDYPTAYLQEQAGIDMILVGDSLGMTMLGFDSTLPVTMEDMIRHTAAVRRGAPNVWLVGDMPYMSYQPSVETAIRNAGRFMAEAGCDAVKLEGGAEMADRVAGIARAGIPVSDTWGYPAERERPGRFPPPGQGRRPGKKIVDDAQALEEAGAFCIFLEIVPDRVCRLITERAEHCIIMSLGSGPMPTANC